MKKNFFIHPSAYADEGARIGEGTKIWHFTHIMPGAEIGQKSILGQNVHIASGARIGNGCKIQNNVSVYDQVIIEDHVFLGPSCVFTNVINPRAFIERKDEYKPTTVKTGATIGANATIVCGVTVGRYAMVGAGAVVTKNVPDFALVYGIPAKQGGWVSRDGEILGKDLVCPRSKRYYKETPYGLKEIEEPSVTRTGDTGSSE